jgi:predicted HNH restriction endonuclease
MAGSIKNDKNKLIRLVAVVKAELENSVIGTPINIYKKPYILKTETDGWSAEIGSMRTYNCSIMIVIDKFSGHEQRKCWYGFRSFNNGKIKSLKTAGAKKDIDKPISITGDDVLIANGQNKLSNTLKEKKAGVVTFEAYEKEYYYGRYDFRDIYIRNQSETQAMAERIAAFIETVSSGLPVSQLSESAIDYPQSENRKQVRLHVVRERSGFIRLQRKQADKFTCQICRDNIRKYGKIGKNIAEAHHIRPLGTIRRQTKTTVNDLITVCPNCHRILHRMKGGPEDIEKLKQLLR